MPCENRSKILQAWRVATTFILRQMITIACLQWSKNLTTGPIPEVACKWYFWVQSAFLPQVRTTAWYRIGSLRYLCKGMLLRMMVRTMGWRKLEVPACETHSCKSQRLMWLQVSPPHGRRAPTMSSGLRFSGGNWILWWFKYFARNCAIFISILFGRTPKPFHMMRTNFSSTSKLRAWIQHTYIYLSWILSIMILILLNFIKNEEKRNRIFVEFIHPVRWRRRSGHQVKEYHGLNTIQCSHVTSWWENCDWIADFSKSYLDCMECKLKIVRCVASYKPDMCRHCDSVLASNTTTLLHV